MTTNVPSAVLRQHKDLRAVTCAVMLELEAGPDVDPIAWRTSMGDVLDEWLSQLRDHFAFEEEHGLFDVLRGGDDPRRASRLEAQHGAFLSRLQRLTQEAPALSGVARTGAFHAEVRRLLEDVTAHEEEENELATAVLERMAGAPD